MMCNGFRAVLLVLAPLAPLIAAPSGSFSASFPSYTFTATCADPVGGSVAFPAGGCNQVGIDYTATGATSIFSNAQLLLDTVLLPAFPPPFEFTGTFSLTNLDDPADSLTGTLIGAGNLAGAPGPPVGFPPFVIAATFVTTGGTGVYAGASGISVMSGTALFTSLSEDDTAAAGSGSMTISAVPEPSTGVLSVALVPVAILWSRRRSGRHQRD
jgi:hypothetical protein